MNFRDMSKDDLDYYNKIRPRDDDLDWVLKSLAILAAVVLVTGLLAVFVW